MMNIFLVVIFCIFSRGFSALNESVVLQTYQEHEDDLVEKIAVYMADRVEAECKNIIHMENSTNSTHQSHNGTSKLNSTQTYVNQGSPLLSCIKGASNFTINNVTTEIRKDIVKLALYSASMSTVQAMKIHNSTGKKSLKTGEKLFKKASIRLGQKFNNIMESLIVQRGIFDVAQDELMKPRFFFFTFFTLSYRITKFVLVAGKPLLKRLLKHGVKDLMDSLKGEAEDQLIDETGKQVTGERSSQEVEFMSNQYLKETLISILEDASGIGLLFEILGLAGVEDPLQQL